MLHIDKAKEIWIYGAGSRAKVLAEYLREEGVDARGFVVSDGVPLVDGSTITISRPAGGGHTLSMMSSDTAI